MIKGYDRLRGEEGDADVDFCPVLVADEVSAFLSKENANDRVNVRQIGRILHRIRQFGLASINNTEQLRNEGKFLADSERGTKVRVYAVKAHQLRVYCGLVRIKNVNFFTCVDAARKKKDKADQAQLARVAKLLGELGDES